MSQIDVRGLLQYVPQFSGKVFVIIIDVPQSMLAETMLDLVSLQNIGVHLVIGSTVHPLDALLDRAAEVELKYCQAEDVGSSLNRGQAVVVDCVGDVPFSESQSQLAVSLSAAKLVLLSAGDGMPARGAIRAADVDVSGDEDQILSRASVACAMGIPRVHILNGSCPAVLLSELFSNEGVGTMVYADSYRGIRPIREDDIVELLGMIGRSVRNAHLVPRGYTDIEKNLSDYSVMDIDGNVVGCVALLRYPDSDTGELACLYVKQAHEGLGYGAELVKYVEKRAGELGLASVFSLTNRAAHFFQGRMGYSEIQPDKIPSIRHQQLLASGRDSRVFRKKMTSSI